MRLEDPVIGSCIIAAAHLPFCWEVLLELRLQAKLFLFIPHRILNLPGAPGRGSRIIFAAPRFQRALYCYVWQDEPGEPPEPRLLKRRLRRSWRRKLAFGLAGFVVLLVLLYRGWRPWSGWHGSGQPFGFGASGRPADETREHSKLSARIGNQRPRCPTELASARSVRWHCVEPR